MRIGIGKLRIQSSQTGTEFSLFTLALLKDGHTQRIHLFAVDPSCRSFPDRTRTTMGEIFLYMPGDETLSLKQQALDAAIAALRECFPERPWAYATSDIAFFLFGLSHFDKRVSLISSTL